MSERISVFDIPVFKEKGNEVNKAYIYCCHVSCIYTDAFPIHIHMYIHMHAVLFS